MKVESVKLQLRSDRSDSEDRGYDLSTTLTQAVVVVVELLQPMPVVPLRRPA